jgi:integrase
VLPSGVHKVIARGREYFYFQASRGTKQEGKRIRLPSDPHTPEFWQAIRQARGIVAMLTPGTFNELIDAYLISPAFTEIAASTQYNYRRDLAIARQAWGALPAEGVEPKHVQKVMDGLARTPAKANSFLGTMKTLAKFARKRGLISSNFAEGVDRYDVSDRGHKPWTATQIKCAHDCLTGDVRRGIMLALYTGQRLSDVVRLGWTDVDENGFRLRQKKTKRDVWCPIVPELAAEMATWEKLPGPFVRQPRGKPITRKHFWRFFDEARKQFPDLQGATMHGLRATAVVRLRQAGLSTGQIGDVIGMSLAMIERYCRFADRKESGRAAVVALARTRSERGLENNGKQ